MSDTESSCPLCSEPIDPDDPQDDHLDSTCIENLVEHRDRLRTENAELRKALTNLFSVVDASVRGFRISGGIQALDQAISNAAEALNKPLAEERRAERQK